MVAILTDERSAQPAPHFGIFRRSRCIQWHLAAYIPRHFLPIGRLLVWRFVRSAVADSVAFLVLFLPLAFPISYSPPCLRRPMHSRARADFCWHWLVVRMEAGAIRRSCAFCFRSKYCHIVPGLVGSASERRSQESRVFLLHSMTTTTKTTMMMRLMFVVGSLAPHKHKAREPTTDSVLCCSVS